MCSALQWQTITTMIIAQLLEKGGSGWLYNSIAYCNASQWQTTQSLWWQRQCRGGIWIYSTIVGSEHQNCQLLDKNGQLVRSHLHLHLQLFFECEQLYCQLLLIKENHVPNFHHLFSCPSLCLAFELWTLLHNRKGNVWNITMAPQCLPTSSGGWWTHYHICFRTITSIIL